MACGFRFLLNKIWGKFGFDNCRCFYRMFVFETVFCFDIYYDMISCDCSYSLVAISTSLII